MFKVGDAVLIFNPTTPKFHLKKGVITQIHKPYINKPQNVRVEFIDGYGIFNEVELERAVTQPKKTKVKMNYYLQRADDLLVWESVDEYTWNNIQYALDAKGNRRYSGNRVKIEGENISMCIEAQNISQRELAVIMRFCGVRGSEAPTSMNGGFVRETEFVQFRKGKKEWMHKMHGDDFFSRKVKSDEPKKPQEMMRA